ncbi:MAG: IMP dehydrogenase [Phycisphaerales bacterium]|nr:IMP dehydrogenase [Phycisphaerales bacterium]
MEARTVSKSVSASLSSNGSSSSGASSSALPVPVDEKIVGEGVTFDDVLLLPRYSDVVPVQADASTQLTRGIRLHIPLVSAPMDTVTESALAIALAQQGGLGVIHRNIPVEVQAREVQKVKRSANGVIADPLTLSPEDTVARARQLMGRFHVSGFPVTEGGAPKGKVLGILTRRDLKFVENDQTPVGTVMTSGRIITAAPGTTLGEAEKVLNKHKVEKLLLVDGQGRLAGMITMRDIDRLGEYPHASLDARGRLRCGGAVGVDQYDRAEALVAADVDVLVVDTSHGHSENVLRTVRTLKKRFAIEVIAGNIATADAARALVDAGADAVKAGIGPGSICTTRVVTGVGVPQLTAVMESVKGVGNSGVGVIADGGIRQSGDIAKAIAAGASAVMMGSMFAGLDEAPGEMVIRQGRRYKSYRGMGSEGAMNAGSADRYQQHAGAAGGGGPGENPPPTVIGDKAKQKFVPEGVEGLIAYRGPLNEFVYQMVGGLKASMGYVGCRTIAEMHGHARFIKVTGATVVENHPHDIRITKESPNYVREGPGE